MSKEYRYINENEYKVLSNNFKKELENVISENFNIIGKQDIDEQLFQKNFQKYFYLFRNWLEVKYNENSGLMGQVKILSAFNKEIKNGQEVLNKYEWNYANLKEGLTILEGFRELLTGQKISYIVASSSQTEEEGVLNKYSNAAIIEGLDLAVNLGNGKKALNIPSVSRIKKINNVLQQAILRNAELKEVSEHILNFSEQLEKRNEQHRYNIYWEYTNKALEGKKISSAPFLLMSDYERWKIWNDRKNNFKKIKDIIRKRRAVGGVNYIPDLKDNNLSFFTKYEGKYYKLLLDTEGKEYEAILHGASFYSYFKTIPDDIDTIAIQAVNHIPFYSSADVYIKLKNGQTLGLQAKANSAKVEGDTIYNIIDQIVKKAFDENGKLKIDKQFLSFLKEQFLSKGNLEIQALENSWFENIVVKNVERMFP